jgi:tetratricopeptide (TPR) repeat protein
MNRGVAHRDLGRPREAYADSHAALALFRAINDRRNQALLLDNLAELRLHDGDFTSALDLYRQGLELGRLLGDARLQGTAHAGIGNAHAAAGHDDAAQKA